MTKKKLLLVLGSLLLFPVIGFAILMLIHVFDPAQWKTEEAETAAVEYAEKKYEGEFTALEAEYTRQLGENGQFQINMRSEKHLDVQFQVNMSADLDKVTDNYKHQLWTKQGNAWLTMIVRQHYPETAVQTGVSFEAAEQENVFTERDSFQDVGKAMPGAAGFFAYIYFFQDEVNPEADAKKLFAIWQEIQAAGFSKVTMNVSYLPVQYRSNFKKHLHQAAHHVNLSTEKPAQSASDIVPLLQ